MKLVDKQALEFINSEGHRLRGCSYDELVVGIRGIQEVTPLTAPEQLQMYRFTILRARLKDGAVRVVLDGERSVLKFGRRGCMDSFDKLPDNSVREIPEGDEDYSGKG